MAKKRRTRQHIIGDLGVNHVERQALLAGFAVDRVLHDYGIDLYISTYDRSGAVENGYILVQVKATDRLKLLADRQTIALSVNLADVVAWMGELLPVILIVYDAPTDVAYYIDVQPYFDRRSGDVPIVPAGTVTVHLPVANRLNAVVFERFAARKNALVQRRNA